LNHKPQNGSPLPALGTYEHIRPRSPTTLPCRRSGNSRLITGRCVIDGPGTELTSRDIATAEGRVGSTLW
jgi:hypothetical protein